MKIIVSLYQRVPAWLIVVAMLAILACAFVVDRRDHDRYRAEACKRYQAQGWENACTR